MAHTTLRIVGLSSTTKIRALIAARPAIVPKRRPLGQGAQPAQAKNTLSGLARLCTDGAIRALLEAHAVQRIARRRIDGQALVMILAGDEAVLLLRARAQAIARAVVVDHALLAADGV